MKLRTILFGAALAAGTQVNAQTWVHDTLSTGAQYKQNVYYSLENGTAGTAQEDDWHIGFSTNVYSASVILNTAAGLKLYEISSNLNDFGTDLTSALTSSITGNPMSFYNSNLTWETGAFNQGSGGYGWGDYAGSPTHWIDGSVIFGLVTTTDTFQILIDHKKTYQVTNAPIYTFRIAKIDGSNLVNDSIALGTTPYNDRNFVYYNITTGTFVNREPASASWDFLFTNYNDENVVFNNEQYKVFGIVNNEKLKVARVDTADTEFDNIASQYGSYTYDTVNNSIGRAWKVAGMSGTSIVDSLCYFIETWSGDVWQLVFTAHNSGSASTDPGLVALKKRKVFDNSTNSVHTVNNDVALFQVYPNPAVNDVNVLIDAKTRVENAQLMITDMTGRTVYRGKVNINTGLNAINVSTANFVNGNYILTMTNGKWNATQKLVVQH